eukprot:TRINITY_DN67399_c6_g1_i6.p1 TRINITY_DN67399_c6_g1~~TRINITY_DN67399_c6_g1_i6.p1  ORF type:complete len:169 (-),score=11.95 TRINITY_DN67399_c6_g1_i6:584-1090(-)
MKLNITRLLWAFRLTTLVLSVFHFFATPTQCNAIDWISYFISYFSACWGIGVAGEMFSHIGVRKTSIREAIFWGFLVSVVWHMVAGIAVQLFTGTFPSTCVMDLEVEDDDPFPTLGIIFFVIGILLDILAAVAVWLYALEQYDALVYAQRYAPAPLSSIATQSPGKLV